MFSKKCYVLLFCYFPWSQSITASEGEFGDFLGSSKRYDISRSERYSSIAFQQELIQRYFAFVQDYTGEPLQIEKSKEIFSETVVKTLNWQKQSGSREGLLTHLRLNREYMGPFRMRVIEFKKHFDEIEVNYSTETKLATYVSRAIIRFDATDKIDRIAVTYNMLNNARQCVGACIFTDADALD